MKTTFPPQRFVQHTPRIGTVVCCLMLLGSLHKLEAIPATFTPVSPYSVTVNIYAYDQKTGVTDGSGGASSFSPGGGTFSGTNTPDFLSIPPAVILTNNPPFAGNYVDPNSSISFNPAGNPTFSGMMLYLNNPYTQPEELRIDWHASYLVLTSGSVPNVSVTISGNCDNYYAVAGEETIIGTNTLGNYSEYTAGPLNNSFTTSPLGPGPWYGVSLNGSFGVTIPLNFTAGLPLEGGSVMYVMGYFDLVVDPGTLQVQISTVPPPALGIGTYSNEPVVFFPTATGTNYNLQMTTNLLTGAWVTVTNGIPFSGVLITNAPSPAFFRLQ
jgi:hypothetical protein